MDVIQLPIDSVISSLVAALRASGSAVLRAPAGAGKTTRVPAALIDHQVAGAGTVLVLQPRRVAARAVARRIAEERGVRLGSEVGYHVRFDRQFHSSTRLIVMTEGVLVRRLQDDPFLEGVAAVVLDEFHERHLDSDLCLAMARRIQQTVRPDLKLLVMSATLDPEPIARYLGNCPIVECEGRSYPVEIRYQSYPAETWLSVQAARGVEQVIRQTSGDVLVFLPGVREIRQTQDELRGLAEQSDLTVLPLYGDLSAADQDRVFATAGRRKVVLATNVAETSITIPGITAVVDTGVARVLQFDANLGLNRLELKPISKAAADQRAGRAGRTEAGVCLRLWPEAAHRHRAERETAEIHRVDLSGTVLQLLDWGEADLSAFPWFEPPALSALDSARGLLERLGACDASGITALGRQLVRLPVAPRIARLLIAAGQAGQLSRACVIAALLTERDPFLRPDRQATARHRSRSDVLDRADALIEYARSRRTQFDLGTLNRGAADFLLQTADQLEQQMRDLLRTSPVVTERRERVEIASSKDEMLWRAILAAFPDRLVRRREPGGRRGVMVGGRGVRLSDQSAVMEGDLFVCVEADAGTDEALVRQASFVDREWLPADRLQMRIDLEFDDPQERVQARRRVCWDGLVLDESPAALPEPERVAEVLARFARERWDRVFPTDNPDLVGFITRVKRLARWMPELELPEFHEEFLQQLLPELCLGRRSFAELLKAEWLELLRFRLTPGQLQSVDREAPERIAVPSGSRVAIQYPSEGPPILAVRIQEIFGWKATPRIAGGRVPLLLHLLAPNHRPQQITDDLSSFWTNAYPIIRGELRRRYPRHAWPDDPWTAQPERQPQRKRRD